MAAMSTLAPVDVVVMGVGVRVLVTDDVAVITGVDDAVTLPLIALSFGGELETS